MQCNNHSLKSTLGTAIVGHSIVNAIYRSHKPTGRGTATGSDNNFSIPQEMEFVHDPTSATATGNGMYLAAPQDVV